LGEEYYQKNREQILAKKRTYYQKNRERIKQRVKKHREDNRDAFLKYKKEYNAAHAMERNEKAKAYYWVHRDEKREYDREYYQQHVEEIKQAVLAYKTQKVAELEAIACRVFDMRCFLCGMVDPSVRIGACFHEKHGNKHEYHRVAELRYVLAHPDDFIPLCRGDHQMSHMLMKKGFVWEEIVRLVREKMVVPVGPY